MDWRERRCRSLRPARQSVTSTTPFCCFRPVEAAPLDFSAAASTTSTTRSSRPGAICGLRAGTYATILKQATASSLVHGIRVTGTSKFLRVTDHRSIWLSPRPPTTANQPSPSTRTTPATGPARAGFVLDVHNVNRGFNFGILCRRWRRSVLHGTPSNSAHPLHDDWPGGPCQQLRHDQQLSARHR